MSIASAITAEILKHIHVMETGEDGRALIPDRLLDVQDPARFLEPKPDVIDDAPDEELRFLGGRMRLLGLYRPMKSHGTVVLFSQNIQDAYWGTIRNLVGNHKITITDLVATAELMPLKTWHHELFHLDCDVLRRIFAGRPLEASVTVGGTGFRTTLEPNTPFRDAANRLEEEALAVARSYREITDKIKKIRAYSKIGISRDSKDGFLAAFIEAVYDFRSPGYCRWREYRSDAEFRAGLVRHLNPGGSEFFSTSGVDIGPLLDGSLGHMPKGSFDQMVL